MLGPTAWTEDVISGDFGPLPMPDLGCWATWCRFLQPGGRSFTCLHWEPGRTNTVGDPTAGAGLGLMGGGRAGTG